VGQQDVKHSVTPWRELERGWQCERVWIRRDTRTRAHRPGRADVHGTAPCPPLRACAGRSGSPTCSLSLEASFPSFTAARTRLARHATAASTAAAAAAQRAERDDTGGEGAASPRDQLRRFPLPRGWSAGQLLGLAAAPASRSLFPYAITARGGRGGGWRSTWRGFGGHCGAGGPARTGAPSRAVGRRRVQ